MATTLVERMAVEVDGTGAPLVMIHGLGGTSNLFTPQMAAMGQRFRVIRPDLPGSGRSSAGGRLSVQLFVDRLAGALRILGVERAWVAGHSLGTIVACHLALQHPALVRGLALFGPMLAPPDAAREGLRGRAGMARAEGMAPIADAVVAGALSADSRASQPVVVALVREMLMRQDAEGYALTCEALAAADPAEVERLRLPVLLMTGDEDAVAPPSVARGMAARIGGAELRILPRCGHWTTFERAAEVNAALKEFLRPS